MLYKPFCHTEIEFAKIHELKQIILSYTSRNIVFIMSESSASRWDMNDLLDQLKINCESRNGFFTWIKDVKANPTQNNITESLQQIGNRPIDLILALGGGSAIDLAKGISAFHNENRNNNLLPEEITNSIKNNKYMDGSFIDIIAIPTTAGTGSEVTQWATIWDENKLGKFSIDAPGLQPKKSIIVPELTLSVPPILTLSTGLDAMCQAIESYWSKHTTPIVQEIAYRAVQLIIQNLRKSLEDPEDLASREKLCKASVLAGIAFSKTRTTACHSISYPLTMLYGVPHGLAVSLTLDAVAKINERHFPNDKELFNLFEEFGGIKNWIDFACDSFVNMKLSSFGITTNDIPIIVENSFTTGRMNNNPVDLTKEQVTQILESIY